MAEATLKSGLAFLIIVLSGLVTTHAAYTPDPNSLFDMSLEELMEVPVVVSASRYAHRPVELSVPVSIISADDIHYSGLTSIPEILQFTAGIDVIPLSRTRYAVGVRGLHDFVADRTLTLINGRPADNAVFGGSEFYRYPVLVEDIERIEIVRGPGGAAWGANAFTGIINIITKTPGSEPGWLLSATVTEYGDSYNHVRTAGRRDRWSWRFSVGYETVENSDAAGAGRMFSSRPALNNAIGFSDFSAMDNARNLRLDSEFSYRYSEWTDISFGTAWSHMESGDWEYLGFFPQDDSRFETLRSFLKINHIFDADTTGYVQWSNNFNDSDQPSLFEWVTVENDIEAQLNTRVGRHRISVGTNLRSTYIDTDTPYTQSILYPGGPFCETSAGLFFIDRFEVNDHLELEGQLRGDWFSDARADWSTRLSALYTLDPETEEVVRLSFAKAFRTPRMITQNNLTSRVPHPFLPGVSLLNVNSLRNLENEQTWAVEAGYSRQITRGILFKTDAYFQRFDRLIAFESNPTVPITFSADNIDSADSWGLETQLSFKNDRGMISLWHAYNDFQEKQSGQPIRSYLPAAHKVGVSARLYLDSGFCLNANYRFSDVTKVAGDTTIRPVRADHRLDLTVSREFAAHRGELMIGVSDVLNRARGPNYTIGTVTAYEVPGRTFFARLQWRF